MAELSLTRLARPDQRRGDFDRVVVNAGKKIDGAQHRVMKAVVQIGDFGELYQPAAEICGTLIEDSLQHKSHRDAARGQRGSHAASGRYRQFDQCFEAAETAALRLVEKLTPQMRRRQIDYRLGQLKSRRVNKASKAIPALRKFSSAPSRRSTTVITFNIAH